MLSLLSNHYNFSSKPHEAKEANPKGLAHLSISDTASSKLSNCRDRKLPNSISKAPSIMERENAGLVPLVVFGQTEGSGGEELCLQSVNPIEKFKKESIKCAEQKNIKCSYIIQQNWTTKKEDKAD